MKKQSRMRTFKQTGTHAITYTSAKWCGGAGEKSSHEDSLLKRDERSAKRGKYRWVEKVKSRRGLRRYRAQGHTTQFVLRCSQPSSRPLRRTSVPGRRTSVMNDRPAFVFIVGVKLAENYQRLTTTL